MKKELLELMEIKDIGLISIYKVNNNDVNDNNIGIKIVYDKDKVLDYNYKYKYFKDYLIRIREVYKRENNNVIIMGDTSGKLLDSFNIDNIFKFDKYNQELIFPFNRVNRNHNLIKYTIKNILNYFNYNKDIKIIDMKNFNQNYQVKYKVENKEYFVNFVLTQNELDEIRFTISYIQNSAIKLEGIINILDYCVLIKWYSLDNLIEGKINSFVNKSYKEEILKANGITIDIKEADNSIKDEERIKINRCLSSINLELVDKGISLCDNTYLLLDTKNLNNKQKRKLSYLLSFDKEYIYILQNDTLGMMVNETTFYPTNIKRIEYILKRTKKDEYILCEKLLNVNDNYFDINNCKYSLINAYKEKENIDISVVKQKIKE